MIVWFTGQPGAGKTTLALGLQSVLRRQGLAVVHLDGEFVREVMANQDYGPAGRVRNVLIGQRLATKIHEEGIDVVASFVSPQRQLRDAFKLRFPVVEVYVHTTEVRGREAFFVPDYEPPLRDFIEIDTTGVTVESCVVRILKVLSKM